MKLGTFSLQPGETIDYDISYVDWLTPGDNVESAQVTVSPASGLTVGATYINDPVVKIWVTAVTAGQYKLTCKTTTADGRAKEDEFVLKVKDV